MTLQESSSDQMKENEDEGAMMLTKVEKLIGYYVTITIVNS
jgi:hypothetical protein